MTVLDLAIVLLLIWRIRRGLKDGAALQAIKITGLLAGTALGVAVAGAAKSVPLDPMWYSLAAGGVLVFTASLGHIYARFIGRRFWAMVRDLRLHRGDSQMGAALAVGGLIPVIWLLTIAASALPSYWLARNAGSLITRSVVTIMPNSQRIFDRLKPALPKNTTIYPHLEPPVKEALVLRAKQPVTDISGAAELATGRVSATNPRMKWECVDALSGSGFLVAPNLVVTNAHVVAGYRTISFQFSNDSQGRAAHQISAKVVVMDRRKDIALLRLPQSDRPFLRFINSQPKARTPLYFLGYPAGGELTKKNASVLKVENRFPGSDIDGQRPVWRRVLQLLGDIRGGNSGGPLVDKNNLVAGMISLDSTHEPERIGYALSFEELLSLLHRKDAVEEVSTGACSHLKYDV